MLASDGALEKLNDDLKTLQADLNNFMQTMRLRLADEKDEGEEEGEEQTEEETAEESEEDEEENVVEDDEWKSEDYSIKPRRRLSTFQSKTSANIHSIKLICHHDLW